MLLTRYAYNVNGLDNTTLADYHYKIFIHCNRRILSKGVEVCKRHITWYCLASSLVTICIYIFSSRRVFHSEIIKFKTEHTQ